MVYKPNIKQIKQIAKKTTSKVKQVGRNKIAQIQKRSTIGAEVEFFICDKNGKIVNEADKLLNKLAQQKKKLDISKEVGHNIIEVGCYPDLHGINTMQSLLENMETLLYVAEEENLVICPLGAYPGEYDLRIRQTGHYRVGEKLFDRTVRKLAARCCGLHIHYALPWGVFDFKKLRLKKRTNSKHKQSLVNAYNFLIAIDPALSTFAQSSPFYQGRLIGKDARALLWRGDRDLRFKPSLYNNFPEFGQLPKYQHTGTDLIHLTEERYKDWIDILVQSGVKKKDLPPYKSILETNWSPLRVSRHGTLEQRGMDINTPLIVLAVSQVIKNILRAIQEDFIQVEVSDRAVEEPFRYEKKTIFIPPFTHVKTELQPLAFYKGLEDDKIFRYCKRLLWLAKEFGEKKNEDILEPLEQMLENRKTVSDEIIIQAKRLGHKKPEKQLPGEIAAEIALTYSNKLFKEMVLFRELVKRQIGTVAKPH